MVFAVVVLKNFHRHDRTNGHIAVGSVLDRQASVHQHLHCEIVYH